MSRKKAPIGRASLMSRPGAMYGAGEPSCQTQRKEMTAKAGTMNMMRMILKIVRSCDHRVDGYHILFLFCWVGEMTCVSECKECRDEDRENSHYSCDNCRETVPCQAANDVL